MFVIQGCVLALALAPVIVVAIVLGAFYGAIFYALIGWMGL
jgi:hypothetical protein